MNLRECPIDASWRRELAAEFASDSFKELSSFVGAMYAKGPCYPPESQIFEAFRRTPFDKVRVVVVGQDPYHGPHEAHGLAFSVVPPTRPPPSLVNIFKEIEREYGVKMPRSSGNLTRWADSGVLLMNAVLTVSDSAPASHANRGWEHFTDGVVAALNARRENLVFMLWGRYAREKGAGIDKSRHLVLECAHPSPLSAAKGFFGCNHFKAANEYLKAHAMEEVDWCKL